MEVSPWDARRSFRTSEQGRHTGVVFRCRRAQYCQGLQGLPSQKAVPSQKAAIASSYYLRGSFSCCANTSLVVSTGVYWCLLWLMVDG